MQAHHVFLLSLSSTVTISKQVSALLQTRLLREKFREPALLREKFGEAPALPQHQVQPSEPSQDFHSLLRWHVPAPLPTSRRCYVTTHAPMTHGNANSRARAGASSAFARTRTGPEPTQPRRQGNRKGPSARAPAAPAGLAYRGHRRSRPQCCSRNSAPRPHCRPRALLTPPLNP